MDLEFSLSSKLLARLQQLSDIQLLLRLRELHGKESPKIRQGLPEKYQQNKNSYQHLRRKADSGNSMVHAFYLGLEGQLVMHDGDQYCNCPTSATELIKMLAAAHVPGKCLLDHFVYLTLFHIHFST